MSATPKPAPEKAPTLPVLAREALTKHSGDTHAATLALVNLLRGDVKLLRSVIEGVVADAVGYRVEANMRTERARIIATNSGNGRGAVIALAAGISNALLDMPLAGGLRLRAAGREDVLRQAQFYRVSADDMDRKARWLGAIADLLTDDVTVGEVLTEERALELWKEAGK